MRRKTFGHLRRAKGAVEKEGRKKKGSDLGIGVWFNIILKKLACYFEKFSFRLPRIGHKMRPSLRGQ
jgi:hypothetical protein